MFRSILVPIDLAQESSWKFAVPQALELAQVGQSKLTVITVVREIKAMFEGVYFAYQLKRMIDDARRKLTTIVHQFQGEAIEIDVEARFGSIGHEILAAAKDLDVDLIIMASHRPAMRDYLIGPNAAHVAQHATCSVLVLRRQAET